MLLVRCVALFVLVDFMFPMVGAVNPGIDKYYSGAGTVPGITSCPVTPCSSASCKAWQYNAGCEGTSNGTCTNCTLPALVVGEYYTAKSGSGLANLCVKSTCQTCPVGFINKGCSGGDAGTCESCGASTPGSYWPVNTGPVFACASIVQPLCPFAICLSGYYLTGCTTATVGTCAPCTGASNIQQYSSYGTQFNVPGSCPRASCAKTCGPGKYIKNCGGLESSLVCTDCTNNVPYTNYYDKGTDVAIAYDALSCSVAPCPVCASGTFAFNCGGISSGTCPACTNTV